LTANKVKTKRKIVKAIIKILITGIALWFVFHIIDVKLFVSQLKEIKLTYFVLAFFAFNISKIVSSIRLQRFYNCIGLNLSQVFNLRLYYVGMFYNLFLPGSIGGDGYKVYLLKGQSSCKTKDLISATLMDRISGVSILFSFSCLMLIGILPGLFPDFKLLSILFSVVSSILIIGLYYLFLKLILPAFLDGFVYTTWLSLLVQLGQVITAFLLLLSLNVGSHYWEYLFLFMLSSVAAVLPFTIGGVGSREFVFLLGYRFLSIDKNVSIAFTMLFFMVLAFSALIGIIFSFSIDKNVILNQVAQDSEKNLLDKAPEVRIVQGNDLVS
jgi:uncharacterized membrane protein YbhN (UPF0104 family)